MTERGSVQEFTKPQLASIASIMLIETTREFHGSIPHAAARTTLNCLQSKLYTPTKLGEALIDDTDRLRRVAVNLKIPTGDPKGIRDIAKKVFDLAEQMSKVPEEELREFLNKPRIEGDRTTTSLNDEADELARRYHIRGLIRDAAREIASKNKTA